MTDQNADGYIRDDPRLPDPDEDLARSRKKMKLDQVVVSGLQPDNPRTRLPKPSFLTPISKRTDQRGEKL